MVWSCSIQAYQDHFKLPSASTPELMRFSRQDLHFRRDARDVTLAVIFIAEYDSSYITSAATVHLCKWLDFGINTA